MTLPVEIPVEEDREHLERIAALRREAEAVPWASDPLATRALIRAGKAEKVKEQVKYVVAAPEVPARLANAVELASCASAARMTKKARSAGWAVVARFGRGEWLGRESQPWDVLALSLQAKGGDRVTAIWLRGGSKPDRWAFESGWHFSPYRRQPGPNWVRITSPDINKLLEAE